MHSERRLTRLVLTLALLLFLTPAVATRAEAADFDVNTWSGLYDALQAGGSITLNNNVKYGEGDGTNASAALIVPADKTVTLDLNGCVIDRGLMTGTANAADNGYVIKVVGSLTLKDSKPDDAHTPAITYKKPITNESVTVTGGVITGGKNKVTGGGVFVEGGTFIMQGGMICGNYVQESGAEYTTAGHGGGVYVIGSDTTPAKFEMTGGTICGNTAKGNSREISKGGGVYVGDGTFTMSGSAKIVGNQAKNESGKESYGGGVYLAHGTFTMSGSATISENRVPDDSDGGVGGGVFIQDGSLKMSGNATITRNEAVDGVNPSNRTLHGRGGGVYFTSRDTTPVLFEMKGNATISDSRSTNHGCGVLLESCGAGSSVTFTMSENATISGGQMLVHGSSFGSGPGGGAYIAAIGGSVTFTMSDQAKIIDNRALAGGGVSLMSDGGEVLFTMNGGSIINNDTDNFGGVCDGGGGVSVAAEHNGTAEFKMTGGTISGNRNTSGGGVSVIAKNGGAAKFNLGSGLTISGNTADGGGGVYVLAEGTGSTATFTMGSNTTISGNKAEENPGLAAYGGGVYIEGSGAELEMDSTGKIVNNTAGHADTNPTLASAGYGGGVYVKDGTLVLNGGTISGNTATECGGGVSLDGTNATASLIMNGNAKITGNTAKNGGAVSVYGSNADITLTMSDNLSITQNTATEKGGCVYVKGENDSNKARFTMNGTISGYTTKCGGGAYVDAYGEFTMNGTISGNTATEKGGGVYVANSGAFTLNGALSNNTATAYGGGVYVDHGTATMGGMATATGNKAGVGGGVCVCDGTLTMESGSTVGGAGAKKNTAQQSGGGVYLLYGTLTMKGTAAITGNKAVEVYGGGVYAYGNSSTVMMHDAAAITGNEAKYGGGVYVHNGGVFKVSGSPTVWGNVTTLGPQKDVFLDGSSVVTVTGDLGDDAVIGVKKAGDDAIGKVIAEKGGTYDPLTDDDMAAICYENDDYTVAVAQPGETNAGKGVLAQAYTVQFSANGGTGIMPSWKVLVTDADAPKPLPLCAFTREGYTFAGWSDGGKTYADGESVKLAQTGHLHLTAQWRAIPKPAPVSSGSSGTPSEPFRQKFESPLVFDGGKVYISPTEVGIDDTVTLTAAPDAGKRLERLTVTRIAGEDVALVDRGSGAYSFTMPGWRIEIKASFAADTDSSQPEAQPLPPGNLAGVVLSPQTITVNGAAAKVEAYNIGGTNYFMLRDLAALLRGTGAQFNVAFDADRDAVVVTRGESYAGAVNESFTDRSRRAVNSYQSVELDRQAVRLTAYNIGGNNFFGLRELAPYLGYAVDYDAATNTAIIESR